MSGGSYGRQARSYHENSHPGGDVIPMHMCQEPSCVEATGRSASDAAAHYPMTGRSEPRQTEDVTHDVRFWGNLHAQGDLFAECDACHWSAGLLGGHTGPQLMDLVRQHEGVPS